MISREYLHTLAAYSRWMNERLFTCCAELTDAQRKRDLGAFFKSIHGTLNHLLLADRMWLSRFTGETFVIRSLAEELYVDFDELSYERKTTDAAIARWIDGVSEADLTGELHYTGIAKPIPRQYPYWFAVVHMFNHQTHHRGQITALLMQLGIDPGATDLISLPERNS
ncbi:MAG: damage-inducible protein DinB [Gammaproteobacteria bacterium]|nr:damage-inducible protein DinB [Gammaproteobacteria bacterium]